MNRFIQSYLSVLCVSALLLPAGGFAADSPQQSTPQQPAPQPTATGGTSQWQIQKEESGVVGRITGPYRAGTPPLNNLNDSTRIEALLRAGNLYLSLQDAIALALENNLDIAIQRYGPIIADTSLEIAQA